MIWCLRNSDKHTRHSDEIGMPNTINRVKFMVFENQNEWRRIVENHPLVWYSKKKKKMRRDWKYKNHSSRCSNQKGGNLLSNHLLNKEYTFIVRRYQQFSWQKVIIVWTRIVRINNILICCQMRTKSPTISCKHFDGVDKNCAFARKA